jgi:hypothetical protein
MAKSSSAGKLLPGDPGYVGRGYPPEHGKIRPGEVKNPYGRKGKAGRKRQTGYGETADFAAEMAELLARPVQAKDGTVFSRAELALNGLMKGVLAGDVRSIRLLMETCDKYLLHKQVEEEEQLGEDDAAILERHRQQVLLSAGVDPNATVGAADCDSPEESDDAEEAENV